MSNSFHRAVLLAGCLLAQGALGIAHAATDNVLEYQAPGPTNTASRIFNPDAPADAERLAQLRGGTDVTNNDMALRGTVGSNIASDVVTGTNSISAGSFANVSGIPIVIQNSGANVLIQNATIINLQMH